ncbi:MAG: DUF5399 family protein [Chlamydiota bacterium]
MTIKPRTIDNLGVESSIRYAKDQEMLDTRLIDESRLIPQRTAISVVKPYVPSEFEQLFTPGKLIPWASFLPPPDFYTYTKPLFSYQLIPSLGSYEKQEADTDKLDNLEDVLKKPHARKHSKGDQSDQEKEKENQEEEKERKVLVTLLQCIAKLDKSLTLINSRRNQYQRG